MSPLCVKHVSQKSPAILLGFFFFGGRIGSILVSLYPTKAHVIFWLASVAYHARYISRYNNRVTVPTPGFDAFTLSAVASELRRTIRGSRVQKVQQPSATNLILSCYGSTGAHRLLLSADPKFFRAHLTQIRFPNPTEPPNFCALCRKYLEGALVEEVFLPRLDRVLHIILTSPDGEKMRLVAELMGRNANIVLVSGAGIVRGAIRPAPANAERPLNPSVAYLPPPGYEDTVDSFRLKGAEDPFFASCPTDPDAARDWLVANCSGIGKFAASEIVARTPEVGSVPAAFSALVDAILENHFEPHSIVDDAGHTEGVWAFEPLTVPAGLRYPRESVSVALDTFYTTLTERTEETDERKILSRVLSKESQFRQKELASAKATLAEAGRATRYEELGNNLLAALYQVPRGESSVTLPDLYSDEGQEIAIPLDPKKSPQENAEGYFQKARKARDAAEYAEGKAVDMRSEIALLSELSDRLERATTREDLTTIRGELTELVGKERLEAGAASPEIRQRKVVKEKPYQGHRIRTYRIDTYTLLVGESAEANDYLTTRVAAPSDLWFHVRAAPGAHGVLRTLGQPTRVPQPVIVRAAEIVAARSKTEKHARIVPVDVVEKRYVRKPRGAKPGLVTYTREQRTLDVTPRL